MRIKSTFEYDADWHEISDEFCKHDSKYQANILNAIGEQFKIWSQDKTKLMTPIQMLEISDKLNDEGIWFIATLCDYRDTWGFKPWRCEDYPTDKQKGKWIEQDNGYFFCSKCGKYPEYQVSKTDFCPSCGTDMRNK